MEKAVSTVAVEERPKTKETRPEQTKSRVVYFDYLRLIACFFIVFIHVSYYGWVDPDVHSLRWEFYNACYSAARWATPVFVMISGALFLGRDRPVRTILRKNVLKIAVVLAFWSTLYALLDNFLLYDQSVSWRQVIKEIVAGHYHLWFLYMIIGLYLASPLLRKAAEDPRLTRYFLILALVTAVLVPKSIFLLERYRFPDMGRTLRQAWDQTRLYIPLGYSGYFLLGYALHTATVKKRTEWLIYGLGILGAAATVLGNSLDSEWLGSPQVTYSEHFHLGVVLMAAAVFVFAKQHLNKAPGSEKGMGVLQALSGATFGVYLVHPLFLDLLQVKGKIFPEQDLSVLVFLAAAAGAYLASLGTALLLKRIPVVKKWLL